LVGEYQFACLAFQRSRQGGEIRIRSSVWPLPIEPDRLLTQIDLVDGIRAALILHCAARSALATPPLLGAARLIAAARRKAVVRVCFDRELGLQLRNKTPKRRVKAKLREDRRPATRSNETWAMDFVHDQLVTGRKLRVLIIVDAFSRFSRRWNRVSHSVALMLWRYSISSFALISYAQVKRFSR
jgi:hypothetical protein